MKSLLHFTGERRKQVALAFFLAAVVFVQSGCGTTTKDAVGQPRSALAVLVIPANTGLKFKSASLVVTEATIDGESYKPGKFYVTLGKHVVAGKIRESGWLSVCGAGFSEDVVVQVRQQRRLKFSSSGVGSAMMIHTRFE
jgi:hypothetical protein